MLLGAPLPQPCSLRLAFKGGTWPLPWFFIISAHPASVTSPTTPSPPFRSLLHSLSLSPSTHFLHPSLLLVLTFCALLAGFSKLPAALASSQAESWAEESRVPPSCISHSLLRGPGFLFLSLCLSLSFWLKTDSSYFRSLLKVTSPGKHPLKPP